MGSSAEQQRRLRELYEQLPGEFRIPGTLCPIGRAHLEHLVFGGRGMTDGAIAAWVEEKFGVIINRSTVGRWRNVAEIPMNRKAVAAIQSESMTRARHCLTPQILSDNGRKNAAVLNSHPLHDKWIQNGRIAAAKKKRELSIRELKCPECNRLFELQNYRRNEKARRHLRGPYCSHQCSVSARSRRSWLAGLYCPRGCGEKMVRKGRSNGFLTFKCSFCRSRTRRPIISAEAQEALAAQGLLDDGRIIYRKREGGG